MLNNINTEILNKTKLYLVALSGGADSVALLRSLQELDYKIEAVHCNFHLRSEESNRDQKFCEKLCQKLGTNLYTKDFDTITYAKDHKVSIEMAARELRYAYFHELIKNNDYAGVCVAHHKDDQVETVLLNLVRGTGIEGLKGMSPQNGEVLRPLLGVSRKEILEYLDSLGQGYVTDSTNLEDEAQRNVIRHKVIPLLHEINPNAAENIAQSTKYVAEVMPLLQQAVNEAHKRVLADKAINITALKQETAPETILWYLLKGKGFNSAQVKQIYNSLDGQSGKQWQSSKYKLLLDRSQLILEESQNSGFTELQIERITLTESYSLSRDPWIADMDADKVKEPLTLRPTRQGDWFVPFGMKGRKLISNFLTDRKVPLFDKQRQLVVEDAEGKIIWLPGQRLDNRVAICKQTKSVLRLTIACNS